MRILNATAASCRHFAPSFIRSSIRRFVPSPELWVALYRAVHDDSCWGADQPVGVDSDFYTQPEGG